MIKIENIEPHTSTFEVAVRGMRNPMNSWDKSDSVMLQYRIDDEAMTKIKFMIGEDDLNLMKKLVASGSDHAKFMRMMMVSMDITAPLYWWKEFDTYKVGTVANSCSTMHKIHAKEFTLDDFSHENLYIDTVSAYSPTLMIKKQIEALNYWRRRYLETKRKEDWWQMIQLLPSSYNQKRTVMLNYAVLRNMYHARKNHLLDEWREFCKQIEGLPYPELITM